MQQKVEESAAISWTNGQLKTKVRIELMNLDCPDLMNVISIAKDHYGDRVTGMLPLAPLVLQFATGKVKLLIKHLVSKLYDNWDLQVAFDKSNWGVQLSGFLYSPQYDAINKKIACDRANLSEIIEAVTQHPEVQPTSSLDSQWIADCYGIREDAEVGLKIILYNESILLCRQWFNLQRSTRVTATRNLSPWQPYSLQQVWKRQLRKWCSGGEQLKWVRRFPAMSVVRTQLLQFSTSL